MTDKEKIAELLHDVCAKGFWQYSNGDDGHDMTAEDIADYLLENGVTIQRWIPVTERLPEEFVDVLTCDAMGHIHVFWHHHEYTKPFNIGKHDLRYFPVTHWMPLPEPPKEG